MFSRSIAGLFVLLALAVALPARAATYAYIQSSVYLRAGPRVGYPVVLVLHAGAPVLVHGCVSDYVWCDVSFNDTRGWVYASYLDYPYHGRRVPIIEYGPELGITIITFNILDYWGYHYSHRPWYRERHEYRSRFGPHGRYGSPPVRRRMPAPPPARRTPGPAPRLERQQRRQMPAPPPRTNRYQERRRTPGAAPAVRPSRPSQDRSQMRQRTPNRRQSPQQRTNRGRNGSNQSERLRRGGDNRQP